MSAICYFVYLSAFFAFKCYTVIDEKKVVQNIHKPSLIFFSYSLVCFLPLKLSSLNLFPRSFTTLVQKLKNLFMHSNDLDHTVWIQKLVCVFAIRTWIKHHFATHLCLASHKMVNGKQCRPRSDAAERRIWRTAAVCDCGTAWTFLLPFLFYIIQILSRLEF